MSSGSPTRPDDPDDLAAGLVLQRVEQALRGRGEIGGVGRRIFLGVDGRSGLGQRLLEGRHAVAAEGVILRQRRDMHPGLADRHRVRNRVLRGIARGAENVAVPLVAGDLIGNRELDDEDLLVLLGHRQHCDGGGGRGSASGDIGAVILISFGKRAFGEVRLALVVLGDDGDLAPVDFHRPLGGVWNPSLRPVSVCLA